MNVTCRLCHQMISPDDTVVYDYGVVHVDCGRPRCLSPEEHVLLYVFCWDHAVARCAACTETFRQGELGADPFASRTYTCLHCHSDLTESMREHLTVCAMLPQQLRRRVKETHEVTRRLIKRGYRLLDRTDVLMRELEAALDELNDTRERSRRKRDEQ